MTTQSAQRVSAGVLLDQELKAGAEGAPKVPVAPKPAAPAAAPKPLPEEMEAKPLETYQAAIERMMKGGDVSVVSIAAAEAQRRAQKGTGASTSDKPPTDIKALLKKISMIGAGVLLLAVAGSVVAYVFLRPTTVPVAVDPASPFISVDNT